MGSQPERLGSGQVAYIYIHTCIHTLYIYQPHITRSTALRWPCVFLIHGKLLIMFDVLVPIGIRVILV